MERISATEAKQSFGKLLDKVSREAVMIEKNGRDYAVMLPVADFKEFEALDDAYWGAQIEQAKQKVSLGVDISEAIINEALSAKD